MRGAILGDIIGSPYEFDMGGKTKIFPLFIEESKFTDDTVMTIAVADALLLAQEYGFDDDEEKTKAMLAKSMRKWGRMFPYKGYGSRFNHWLNDPSAGPYGSFGNGSAMRVSSAGWLYDSLEETRKHAKWTAEVTHNHPDGIKGAVAAASAIFLARSGVAQEGIREYIEKAIKYDLSYTLDEIRPSYRHFESCEYTVPEAVTAFLEGRDFEDVIRNAVSLGGDCDTLTCIAGSIGEAYFDVPEDLKQECRNRIPADMNAVLDRFDKARLPRIDCHDRSLSDFWKPAGNMPEAQDAPQKAGFLDTVIKFFTKK